MAGSTCGGVVSYLAPLGTGIVVCPDFCAIFAVRCRLRRRGMGKHFDETQITVAYRGFDCGRRCAVFLV